MHKKRINSHIKKIAFSEIFIMVLAIVAFAFILGESNLVSAPSAPTNDNAQIEPAILATPGLAVNAWEKITKLAGKDTATKVGGGIAPPEPELLKPNPPSTGTPFGWKSLGDALMWAGIAYAVGKYIGGLKYISGNNPQNAERLGRAAAVSVLLNYGAHWIFPSNVGTSLGLFTSFFPVLTIGLPLLYYLAKYESKKTKVLVFTCETWKAPAKGEYCEECNNKEHPCTEYKCKALGQSCELLNKNKPGEELCFYKNRKDSNSPTITPWKEALSPEGLSYIEDTSIRPPAIGVKIVNKTAVNKCLKPFTRLKFGVNTNEPAWCKIDYNSTKKFDDMRWDFGGSNSDAYNHTQELRLPGMDNVTGPELVNGRESQFFVRCKDAMDNYNVDAYSIKFCVDASPDTTSPTIEETDIVSGSFVAFNKNSVPIEVYVSEPSDCKWSLNNQAFEKMENNMDCASEAEEINARLSWTCKTNLTGIKNNAENKYFFRCKDKANNTMTESYLKTDGFVIKGSQELNIVKVSPNETITGSTPNVPVNLEVETDDGAEEGKAWCYFSSSGAKGSYVEMFETGNFISKQPNLQLTKGKYTYFFMCADAGGNAAYSNTSFSVFVDLSPPYAARIYNDEGIGLKIVTNENAECVYNTKNCNFVFKDGLPASHSSESVRTESYLEWKGDNTYYVKCKDDFGNEPSPNECSAIVKPVVFGS